MPPLSLLSSPVSNEMIAPMRHFLCGRFRFRVDPSARAQVMGILNVTPDSFSDGGRYQSLELALTHAEQMIADGVDIIDIGGESSRPGALALSDQEELDRVMPVLYALRDCGKALSIDTTKPVVMREAIAAGVDLINDIRGFRDADAIEAVRHSDCGLCVMHMQGQPGNMQLTPQYEDVFNDVIQFLAMRLSALAQAGVERRRLCIDPGFGFGKTLAHNLTLLQKLPALHAHFGLPVLAGLSRKSMIGSLTGRQVEGRLAGSIGGALAAVAHGARIVRVHDVAQTVDALTVWQAAQENNRWLPPEEKQT